MSQVGERSHRYGERSDLIPKTCLNGLSNFQSICSSRVSNMLMSVSNACSSKGCANRHSLSGRLRPLPGKAPTGATS